MARLSMALAIAGLAVSFPGRAQLADDTVPTSRIVTPEEQLKTDLENSRLRLGPFRFVPGVIVENAGYNSNIFGSRTNPVGDGTATVLAGTKLIVPFGSKVYFYGDAFPGYTWYASHSDLDAFSGAANASFAGYFNRLSAQVGGHVAQGIVTPTPDQPAPTLQKSADGFGKLDVDLTHHLALFVGAEIREIRQTQEGVPLPDRSNVAKNNRTDYAGSSGFRLYVGDTWTFAPEIQYTRTQFVLTPEERDNTSVGYLMGIRYNRPRFYVDLVGGYRVGKSHQGNSFPSYATPVGSFFLSYFLRPWLEVRGYGGRHVYYSVSETNPYYYGNKVGGGLNIQVLPRVLLRGYAETGTNKYPIAQPIPGGSEVKRQDDLVSYGGGISVIVYKKLTLTGLVTQRNDTSNVPGAGYSYLQYSTFLNFTGEFMR